MKKIISLTLLVGIMVLAMSVPTFASNSVDVNINGEKLEVTDVKAEIVDGELFVPLRAVFEKLGATVMWIEENATIIVSADDNKVIAQIGNNKVFLNNDNVIELEKAPYIVNNRTLISPVVFKEIYNIEIEALTSQE